MNNDHFDLVFMLGLISTKVSFRNRFSEIWGTSWSRSFEHPVVSECMIVLQVIVKANSIGPPTRINKSVSN